MGGHNGRGSSRHFLGGLMATYNYDPKAPVYAAPNTEFNAVNVDGQALTDQATAGIDESKATVSGQMTGLLNQNSPYMQAATAGAMRTANQRGLLNSSIAAGEGQKAAIESSMPIAQQDAGFYQGIHAQNAKAISDSFLNNQIGELDYNKSVTTSAQIGAQTAQDYAGKFALQKLSDYAQERRVEIDNAFKLNMNADNLDSAERQQLLNIQGAASTNLTSSIERIQRDTNISGTVSVVRDGKTVQIDAKQAAIETLMSGYKSTMNTAAALVGLKLTW